MHVLRSTLVDVLRTDEGEMPEKWPETAACPQSHKRVLNYNYERNTDIVMNAIIILYKKIMTI